MKTIAAFGRKITYPHISLIPISPFIRHRQRSNVAGDLQKHNNLCVSVVNLLALTTEGFGECFC